MFGISPADLPWWGWLLCGVGAAIAGFSVGLFADTSEKKDIGWGPIAVAILCWFAAVVCMGIINGVSQQLNTGGIPSAAQYLGQHVESYRNLPMQLNVPNPPPPNVYVVPQ